MIEDIDAFYAGILLSFRSIDGADTSVWDRRAHHLSVKHAGQIDVGGVASASGGLQRTIDARHALTDMLQIVIERQCAGLIDGDKALDRGYAVLCDHGARNAGGQRSRTSRLGR